VGSCRVGTVGYSVGGECVGRLSSVVKGWGKFEGRGRDWGKSG
jgi:hypothetical protein